MIENGSNINQKTTSEGFTPLMIAVKRGHIDIAKYLIKIGAIIEDTDYLQGNSALHMACELGELDIVEMLATEDTFCKIFNLKNQNN